MGNSSSTASSSTTITTNGEQYDVFLSFKGEDTRDGFTSHLYKALDEKQIKTFRDDKLVRGEEISEGILSAIGESRISVIVFSEKYTSSKWCLLELAEIMKYREMKKQIVIPVFYKVEPFDVRKSYEAAFAMHEDEWRHFQEEKKIEWRPALTQASQLSGIVVPKGRDESELVCNIVRDVWNKLYNISPSYDFKDLVGIEKHITGVVSKLCLEVQDFRIIGIWGMGGMGKTTIAHAVFRIISDQFKNKTYFTASVRVESENGLIHLRSEIISQVLNIENQNSSNRCIPQRTEEMLKQTKVLIVLDDVDSFRQLETLAGDLDRLGPGSRIILTTRDKQVLRNCGLEDHNMYEVKGLNDDEALQLFCKYSFKLNHPTKDFEDLSREVVTIARNVPLAVKVLGSSLHTKSKRDWKNAKDKFQRNVDPQVFDVLKISYDGLHEEEKGLFLDIACFAEFPFHIDVEDFETNLLTGRGLSLSVLIDKSLVTVENGWIRMHDLLREMGMEIASKNRSRLWRKEDVIRTLKHNDGITNAVQGILLDLDNIEDKNLISQAIEKMYNLRTLIIYGTFIDGGLDYLPDGLRYLHWKDYPLGVLPSSFNPVNLVELDLSHSNIEQLWEGRKHVPKLKLLNLSGCKNLIGIPDLSDIPSAVIIDLTGCQRLIEIHSSSECRELKRLNLFGCEKLNRIPNLSYLPSAEIINLGYCRSLCEILSSGECPKLKQLYLTCCHKLTRIPDLSNIPSAESIDLESCSSLIEIHSSTKCPKLKRLNLSYCENLIRIPDLADIPSAKIINLECCSSLIEIHSSRECPKLKRLNLSHCENLIRIPDLSDIPLAKIINLECCSSLIEIHSSRECPKNLHSLQLKGCKSLSSFPSNIHIEGSEFSLFNCNSLTEFPHISGNITRLDLGWSGVEEVPLTIQSLSKLESLDMNHCESLKRISTSICKLKSLNRLDLSDCSELESFPDILEGMELKYLNLSGTAIKELPPSIGYLNKLDLTRCCKLESFPDILEGMKLKYLNLRETAIKELPPSIGNLNRLQQLVFSGCKNLERLPKSIKILSKLYSLKLNDCGMLQSLPELPSSLRRLEAVNCKQLIQSLPDESEFEQAINCKQLIQSLKDEYDIYASAIGSLYFNFINCLKMNQKAVSNLLIFFRDSVVLKVQRMGTEKIISLFERDKRKVVEGSIFLPGSEIPKWFSYKNNGSSINIPGLRNDCGRSSYIMGFAVCLVIGFDSDIRILGLNDVRYDFHIETRDGHKEGFFHNFPTFLMPSNGKVSYSDHIFLGYNLSSKCYELFQKLDTLLANRGMSDDVGTSFAFKCYGGWYKVKHCGIQPINVQSQVMNSDVINQDTCESNDTEETCELRPKRICTEANRCS